MLSIIGLGYVGLPLSLQFARNGERVLGLDIDQTKVDSILAGKSYIHHIPSESIQSAVSNGLLDASTDFSRIRECEAVIICVPTPLSKNREPDISYILNTARAIAPHIQAPGVRSQVAGSRSQVQDTETSPRPASGRGAGGEGLSSSSPLSAPSSSPSPPLNPPLLIVLESTTYPGTTDEDLRHVLESGSGLKAGVDFHLAFSPEREDPGNPDSKVAKIPKVVGGLTPACLERAIALYSKAVERVVPVSSCRAAEATKLLENIFRSVNIALVNELKVVYGAMGIDVWEVIEAAKTKPFGYMPFYPGPGLGGHCIPIDPFYLTWKAREYGQPTRFIELAGEINTAMPEHVVRRLAEALNQHRKPVNGSKILIVGLAYKANVDDDRESPSYVLMDLLKAAGAELDYYDPYVPVIRPSREHSHWAGTKSIRWTQETVSNYDVVLIVTAHANVDYSQLVDWSQLVIDTRNATRAHLPNEKVVLA
jgi:UDP-N-acetyl-D-glucosamine dehydrogenase